MYYSSLYLQHRRFCLPRVSSILQCTQHGRMCPGPKFTSVVQCGGRRDWCVMRHCCWVEFTGKNDVINVGTLRGSLCHYVVLQ